VWSRLGRLRRVVGRVPSSAQQQDAPAATASVFAAGSQHAPTVAAACAVPQQGDATGASAAAPAVEPARAGVWQPQVDVGAAVVVVSLVIVNS
jgi:hypothetical protein